MSQARNVANLGVHTTTAAGAVTFLDGATDIDIAQHDGTNGLKLGGTLVSATAAELNYNDITTLGTSQASKVLTANSTGHVTISDTIVVGNNGTNGLRLGGVLVTTTGTTLNNAATTGKAIAMAMVFGG